MDMGVGYLIEIECDLEKQLVLFMGDHSYKLIVVDMNDKSRFGLNKCH
jgi:hypothetical protein